MFFFNKKHTIAASGILQGATDHHSHILPGVDDGVETIAEALRILATYETLGIKELWLTPHIMEDIPNSPAKLQARFEELKAAYIGNITLHLAAEYMIDNHLRKVLEEINSPSREYPQEEGDEIKKLRPATEGRWHKQSDVTEGSETTNEKLRHSSIGEVVEDRRGEKKTKECTNLLPIGTTGKHILVETSYYNAPMRFNDTLQQIKSLGYFPLLAHPERYMYLDNADYHKLHSQSVKFQLNLVSLAGGYGKAVKKKAEWLLTNGLYSVAGSDLHCEEAIEYITKCKLSDKEVEQVKALLQNVL